MGWCSGTDIFDEIAGAILASGITDHQKENHIEVLIKAMESHDWDCQGDAVYYNHPLVRRVFARLHTHWFDKDELEEIAKQSTLISEEPFVNISESDVQPNKSLTITSSYDPNMELTIDEGPRNTIAIELVNTEIESVGGRYTKTKHVQLIYLTQEQLTDTIAALQKLVNTPL